MINTVMQSVKLWDETCCKVLQSALQQRCRLLQNRCKVLQSVLQPRCRLLQNRMQSVATALPNRFILATLRNVVATQLPDIYLWLIDLLINGSLE
jgi:hypothetical protein